MILLFTRDIKTYFLYLVFKLLDKKIFHEKVIVLLVTFLMFLGVSNQVYSAVGYSLNTTIIQDSDEMEVSEDSLLYSRIKKTFY